MKFCLQHRQNVTTVIGSIFAAFFVYLVLSFLFVTPRITVPISITIAILVFGMTRFRINLNDENIGNNYVGLKWKEGDSEYFVKLMHSGLAFQERTINNQHYKILTNNSEIEKRDSIWYKVNIENRYNGNRTIVFS